MHSQASQTPDYLTLELLDTVFGAIVHQCKGLRRLSLSGLLTDRVFHYIGAYAKKLEMLSVAFVGNCDLGLHYVLSGCGSLSKLEIRDCPLGDKVLLANAAKLETMQYLCMSSCSVSYGACKLLDERVIRIQSQRVSPSRNSTYTGQWQDGGSTCLISFGPLMEMQQHQRHIELGISP